MNDDDLNRRRERLRGHLADPVYSEQYADSVLFENVSAQVKALRRQRGMTQEQLAERIRSKQPRVSNVESPKEGEWPNWEVSTLNRIAHALGTRLEIRLRSYGSMVPELGTVTSESLRIPAHVDDPIIFPLPPAPEPNPQAPERTRWMQDLMIPWLWADELDLDRLYDWLNGRGLPPVGHDEEPYQWLLRGIDIRGPVRDHLEKRFAERLSILLGEEPDVAMNQGGEDFLRNLYWTCAGMRRRSFLAEQLWFTYKRLKETKLPGDVRDALQAALVQNEYDETKPLKEIWEPMVERGRQRWLRGSEIVGYEGILVRHETVKKDIDKVLWALGRIARRWDAERIAEFKRLLHKVPDLGDLKVYLKLLKESEGWPKWARDLVPVFGEDMGGGSGSTDRREPLRMAATVRVSDVVFYAEWNDGGDLLAGIRGVTSTNTTIAPEKWRQGGPRPKPDVVLDALLTTISDIANRDETEIAADAAFVHPLVFAKARAAGA